MDHGALLVTSARDNLQLLKLAPNVLMVSSPRVRTFRPFEAAAVSVQACREGDINEVYAWDQRKSLGGGSYGEAHGVHMRVNQQQNRQYHGSKALGRLSFSALQDSYTLCRLVLALVDRKVLIPTGG